MCFYTLWVKLESNSHHRNSESCNIATLFDGTSTNWYNINKETTLWPFFVYRVQLSQGYIATKRSHFNYNHYVPRSSRYSFNRPRNMKGWVDLGATQWF